MAPVRHNSSHLCRRDRNPVGSDRKTRKPLVEKKRRARINESLQELRVLVKADVKMENAEVLETTVKGILQKTAQELEAVNGQVCERFAAGYIQCMHDVHTFVSNCPGIEPSVATEFFNYLLGSMPLNNKDMLRLMALNSMEELPGWSLNESWYSITSSDELCSDLADIESEHFSFEQLNGLSISSCSSKPMWRPW